MPHTLKGNFTAIFSLLVFLTAIVGSISVYELAVTERSIHSMMTIITPAFSPALENQNTALLGYIHNSASGSMDAFNNADRHLP